MTPAPIELDRELLDVARRRRTLPASPRNLDGGASSGRAALRQRPAWASLERWLPMAVITARPALAPPLRLAWLLLITLLVLAMATGSPDRWLDDCSTRPPRFPRAVMHSSPSARSTTARTARRPATSTPSARTGPTCASSPTVPEWEADPAWSPDGTRIAFRSWARGHGQRRRHGRATAATA